MNERANNEATILRRNQPGQVVSRDGTSIAYDKVGSGPPVVLIDGALCSRTLGPSVKLAPLLAEQFTVFAYDRRGRGDSGENSPYDVAREVEDLDALISEAGGSALVFGHSSGAVLALRAAAQGLSIKSSRSTKLRSSSIAADPPRRTTGHRSTPSLQRGAVETQ